MGDVVQTTSATRPTYEVAAAVAPVPQGLLVFAVTGDYLQSKSSHEEECPDIGPACASATPPKPYRHDLTSYAYGLTFDVQYGLAPWLSIVAIAPVRFLTSRIRYADLAGNEYDPVPPDTHHRNETIAGLGDPSVGVVLGRAIDRVGFSVRIGAMLPFGRTLDRDPFEAGRAGIEHEHAQFGVGIVRPMLGSALGYDFGSIGLDGWFLGTMALSANSIGYRPGQRIGAGFRLSSALGTKSARVGLGAEMTHESTETWHGMQEEEGNLGRTDVLAVLSARFSPFARWGFFGAIKLPVYVNAVGAQLTYPFVVQLGAATGFSL